HVMHYIDHCDTSQGYFAQELYKSHGYPALKKYFHRTHVNHDVIYEFPCNLSFLQNARGVIVHSQFSRQLIEKFYQCGEVIKNWARVPMVRQSLHTSPKIQKESKNWMNFEKDDFVVCSFGMLGLTKLSHRLLNAWLESKLAKDKQCFLVFV